MEEGRSTSKILAGKAIGNIPLGRPRLRWGVSIRIDLKKIGINTKNWVDSVQDRNYWKVLVNGALNLRVP